MVTRTYVEGDDGISRGAIFSHCKQYRFRLDRMWDERKRRLCAFVMLNPSTADEYEDDPTIRRCMNFAKDWGFGGCYIANIFALRTPHPKVMKAHAKPLGVGNDDWIDDTCKRADLVIAAWGANGNHQRRDWYARRILRPYKPKCLGMTKNGHPRHPLYVSASTEPIDFLCM